MLGQCVTTVIPQVLGMRLVGALPEGTTATDLVITVVQLLRAHGVVGKFVEVLVMALAIFSGSDKTLRRCNAANKSQGCSQVGRPR